LRFYHDIPPIVSRRLQSLALTLGKDGIGTDIRRYCPMSRERIRGERAGNLERAIAIYNVTFTLYTYPLHA
jgi:hypothetical protein